MGPDCDPAALDALSRGEIVADREALDRHVARCERCARELAWLRAERDLLCARAATTPPVDRLWSDIAARLEPVPPRETVSPYRTPAPPPRAPERRPWAAFAAGVAVATAAFAGLAALTFTLRRPATVTVTTGVGEGSPARSRAFHATGPARFVEVPVTGDVRLHLETWSADVTASAGDAGAIRVTVRDGDGEPRVTRGADGRYELRFGGGRLGRGAVDLALPRGSSLDVTTSSGDVTATGLGGALRVETTSGEVRASDVRASEIFTSSGGVELSALDGGARVRTVSGDVRVRHATPAGADSIETSSGDVAWSGACAQGCQVQARTVSGDVSLAFVGESGFDVRFTTVSGDLDDELRTGATLPDVGRSASGRYGSGAGSVAVATTSGSLTLTTR